MSVGAQIGLGYQGDAWAPYAAAAGLTAGKVIPRASPVTGMLLGAASDGIIGGGPCG